ncbi:NAD-dependent epimerase/dehydratase family protein [Rhodoligotrophos ferricapiens]|uniref:NAD-dependent epimerase/dehydratase family protein n=1 Tax=Rhodoligotrophos ferricapiens TaxID=3069264 RepID=UPI00315D07A2
MLEQRHTTATDRGQGIEQPLRPLTLAVTGGSGFVGGHLIPHLLERGHSLRLLIRNPGRMVLPRAQQGTGELNVIQGDLGDPRSLRELCDGADLVVHCAGLLAARHRSAFATVNIEGTARLVDAAIVSGVRRMILLSSLAAREPALSDYAWSKRGGEEALASAGSSLSWVVLRPPAVYGPGDRATLPLVEQLARRHSMIPACRTGRVSLIHVRDVVSAISHVIGNTAVDREVCEIDDGKPGGYDWQELKRATGQGNGRCIFLPRMVMAAAAAASMLWSRLSGKPPMLSPGKVAELYHPDWVCRTNRLSDLTGWHPQVPFTQGFAETLDWYHQAGWLSAAPA